ncbi:uncharacterized protein RB166_015763 isoform 1-T1 [Leptodactylus fuscus]|uniref:uncharacterized protein LOC142217577 isoform X1 n=1 Tax=Leptodactylus fuscus TaxID=238119 RepID=UPI003F4F34E6
MDIFQLRNSILSFSLAGGPRGDQGYSRVLLQLFGYTGHGKSSLINSCKYVLDDGERFLPYAVAGEKTDGGAMTMLRKAYNLTENISIVDNRGYTTMNSFQRAEVYSQLGNFMPIGEEVMWSDNYLDMMSKLEDAELNPNYSDFIVPILVYSATNSLTSDEKLEVKRFMDNCVKLTGVFPIIVITKKTSGDFILIEKAFQLMGAEVIISVENYTKDDHIKTQGRTRDILMIIHKALTDVTFRLGQERNAREDWVRRKKFLLEYIHKADQEKREQEIRREEEEKRRYAENRPRQSTEREETA